MSVGIFIDGRRPKSKKEVREVVALGDEGLRRIELENTSAFNNKFDCTLHDFVNDGAHAVHGREARIDFVGPDPYRSRKFYGNIYITATGKVTVK